MILIIMIMIIIIMTILTINRTIKHADINKHITHKSEETKSKH